MPQDTASSGCLVLDGSLTIRNAEALCATLREAVGAQPSVAIDCNGAAEVDLSFVQLLIAARLSAQQSGKTVILHSAPDGPLLDTLERGGFRVTDEDETLQATAFWFEGAEA